MFVRPPVCPLGSPALLPCLYACQCIMNMPALAAYLPVSLFALQIVPVALDLAERLPLVEELLLRHAYHQD